MNNITLTLSESFMRMLAKDGASFAPMEQRSSSEHNVLYNGAQKTSILSIRNFNLIPRLLNVYQVFSKHEVGRMNTNY